MYLKSKELRCFLKNLQLSRESETFDTEKREKIDTAQILFHSAESNLRDVSVLEPRTLFRATSRRVVVFAVPALPETPERVSHENMGDI